MVEAIMCTGLMIALIAGAVSFVVVSPWIGTGIMAGSILLFWAWLIITFSE